MSKINIISVGNFRKNSEYQTLFEEYRKRIKWDINLIETKKFMDNNIEQQKQLEAKEIIKHINSNYKTIILDERGNIISTTDFATTCNKYFITNGGINFIIGGSNGLSTEILQMPHYKLSFGKMVFPHLMVRVMLMEQLYRIYTLNIGHPYHK